MTPSDLQVIRFDTVCFRYPGRLQTLHGISLSIKAGEITVLMGPSGCGKSTMLALLHRLHRPESGRIFFNDIDSESVALSRLRKMISVLPQRVDLISGTIAENLAPADPQPDMRRLATLCREIGILEFVESLPHGFESIITEGGTNLSGGQKKRIAIVRAIYADAPVFLFDEPHTSLDTKADDMLMEVLVRLRNQGKTVVVAAHSRRILKITDVLVKLDAGRIISVHRRGADGVLSNEKTLVATRDGDLAAPTTDISIKA